MILRLYFNKETEPVEAVWHFINMPPCQLPLEVFIQMGRDPGLDHNSVEGLYLSSGLGIFWDPVGVAGKCCLERDIWNALFIQLTLDKRMNIGG